MNFESVAQALEQLHKLGRTYLAYVHAQGVMELDAATMAPKGSWEGRGVTTGVLSEVMYDLIADPKNGALVAYLKEHFEELTPQEKREVEVLEKNHQRMNRIPAEEYIAYNVLLNDAQAAWEKAKNADDFSLFCPFLQQIVDYNRKFAGYYDPELPAYDALLNEYEEDMTMEILDEFFGKLRSAIVPLLEKIRTKNEPVPAFVNRQYPLDIQRKFSDFLMETMGLNRNFCGIAESEHPFTINYNNKDVRITTHYFEKNLLPSMFSVIHEGGHALYELGADSKYNYTFLYGGASMGIHESQSRFYENLIGRSFAFVKGIVPGAAERCGCGRILPRHQPGGAVTGAH